MELKWDFILGSLEFFYQWVKIHLMLTDQEIAFVVITNNSVKILPQQPD